MAPNMEIIKKRVQVEMALGDCFEEMELEHEIEFPVRVRKIKDICVKVRDVTAQAEDGKVCVQGKLCKRFTWVADCNGEYDGVSYEAGGIYDLPSEDTFSHFLVIPNVVPSANVEAEVRLKKIGEPTKSLSGDLVPDIWKQSVLLEVYTRADIPVEAEIVTDVYAPNLPLKVEKATCGMENLIAECDEEIDLVADIDFSRCVAKIVNVQARITDLKTEALTDKVRVSGVLHKRIYYVEQGSQKMYETTVEEPWNEVFDLPGVGPGMEVKVKVSLVYCEVKLKPEDNKKARQNALLKVKCKVIEDTLLSYVKNVEGTNCQLIKGKMWCNDLVGYGCAEVVICKEICFDYPVKKIVSKDAAVSFDYRNTAVNNGVVKVVGELDKNICYLDRCEGAVWEKCFQEPFEVNVDLPDAEQGMKAKLSYKIKDIDFRSPEYPDSCCNEAFASKDYLWKQTAVLEIWVKVFAPRELEVVTDIICEPGPTSTPCPTPPPCPTVPPCPTKPPCPSPTSTIGPTIPPTQKPDYCPPGQPSMRFYVIQQGDTLYKLAQRYGTTVEAIMALNPGIDPYNLQIGQVIRIPCGVPGAKG